MGCDKAKCSPASLTPYKNHINILSSLPHKMKDIPPMIKLLLLAFSAVALTACGSTSDLASLNTGLDNTSQNALSLASYNRVIVHEFENKTGEASNEIKFGSLKFAEHIADNLKRGSAFREVVVQKSGEPVTTTPQTILVDGEITRFVEGNQYLRMFVGMGAGSSYFDATINVRDAQTGKIIAQSSADLNSWGLGGALAANQTVYSFMDEAARKIANDIAEVKNQTINPAGGALAETKTTTP